MNKRNAIRFERYWQWLKMTIAGALLSSGLIESLVWGRNRINTGLDLFKTKVVNELEMTKQYKRQSDALEQILEQIKERNAANRTKGYRRPVLDI